jgi:SNF2 family DNA or RNA helicase
MGLGKTLEIISLILSTKNQNTNKTNEQQMATDCLDQKESGKLPDTHSTLIVVPTTLLGQWENEINKSLLPNRLTMVSHTKKLSGKKQDSDPKEYSSFSSQSILDLRRRKLYNYDIVLTTYKMLKTDSQTFSKVKWHRICVDEMQYVKNVIYICLFIL